MSTFYPLGYAQQLAFGPLSTNPSLQCNVKKQTGSTIDSMFVFISDTLQLPLFDDFSPNKFPHYHGDLNAPGVTTQLFYRLTDPVTLLPIDNSLAFTGQVTFKRTYDLVSTIFSDSIF
ncbi:MAG: hypothetical protein ACKN86_02960, partial [Crocinitomicaceae bacterium]